MNKENSMNNEYINAPETGHSPEVQAAWHAGIDAGRDIERGNAAAQEPVAWVAADTLNSPHPTCISSLAYMSQIDRERGRAYVPLAIIDRYAAPSSAQPAVNGYTCTVPDDCETLHWRGQILSMNELAAQKAGDGDALRRLADEKFFSGNAVPVERITITRAEYDAAMQQQSRENK